MWYIHAHCENAGVAEWKGDVVTGVIYADNNNIHITAFGDGHFIVRHRKR